MSRAVEGPYRDPRRIAAKGRLRYGKLSPLRFQFLLLTCLLLLMLVAGLAGRASWLFELCTHFPVQIALGLGLCALVLSLFRAWRWVLFAVIGAAFAMAQWRTVAGGTAPDVTATHDVRVLLANVHTQNRSFERVAELIRETRADLVVLQEIDKAWNDALAVPLAEYPARLAEPRSDHHGLVVAARDRRTALRLITGSALESVPGALVDLPVGSTLVKVVVLHTLPPVHRQFAKGRNEQLAAAARLLGPVDDPKLVVGDLNASPWSPHLLDLVRDAGLTDPRRHGFGRLPTWPAHLPSLLRIPIDHILPGGGLEVVRLRLGGEIGSDHRPLIADLRLAEE